MREFLEYVLVCVTSYYEVGVGEEVLGLHQGTSMTRVEEVKDAVGVNSDWSIHWQHTTHSNMKVNWLPYTLYTYM